MDRMVFWVSLRVVFYYLILSLILDDVLTLGFWGAINRIWNNKTRKETVTLSKMAAGIAAAGSSHSGY